MSNGPVHNNLVVVLGVILTIVFIVFAFIHFTDSCKQETEGLNRERLKEYSNLNAYVIKDKLNEAKRYVANTAVSMGHVDDFFTQRGFDLLDGISAQSQFNRMYVSTSNGQSYSTLTKKVENIRNRDFYKILVDEKAGISQLFPSDFNQNENVFMVYAPIYQNGKYTGSVWGIFEVNEIYDALELEKFSGEEYAHIIRQSGELVIESRHENRIVEVDNAWDFYRTVDYDDDMNFETFYHRVQDGFSGFISCNAEGRKRLIYYQPLGLNDWYILSIVPKNIIANYSAAINIQAVQLLFKIIFGFLILVVGIILYSNNSRKAVLYANNQLYISNERLKIAASNIENDFVEYDISKNKMFRILDISPHEDYEAQIASAAREFKYRKYILPECKQDFEDLLQRLQAGEERASCVIKLQQDDNKIIWNHLVFTNLFDDDRKPIRAIGTIEDITSQKEIEFRFAQGEQYRQVALTNIRAVYVFNITNNRYVYAYDEKDDPIDVNTEIPYKQELSHLVMKYVHPEDQARTVGALSISRLKEAYDKGMEKVSVEYKIIDAENVQWVDCITNLLVEPGTGDLLGYSYIKDITEEKLNELALRFDAERDFLTGLLNRQTISRRITEYLEELDDEMTMRRQAFLMLDLDKFKDVNDTYGHIVGDELLVAMAKCLTDVFGRDAFIGRQGGDEFVVFMKEAASVQLVKDKASEVCAVLRKLGISENDGIVVLPDENGAISSSIGIAFAPMHGKTLQELYKKADIALYAAKNAGRDQYVIYHPTLERNN